MARKREPEVEKDNGERWTLTYLDMITLLFIFFVVLYSMSRVDAEKFQTMADSLNKALGGKIEIADNQGGPNILGGGVPPDTLPDQPEQNSKDQETTSIEEIKAILDKFAADNNLGNTLVNTIEERGLVVSINETLLFASGSADITAQAREILSKVGTVLGDVPNQIKVEGHTDNLPINTMQFPSNWELSAARSTNVVKILQAEGMPPNRLSAAGYGEYRPIASNDTEAGRTRNRRIDLVILRTRYDLTEPSVENPDEHPFVPTSTSTD